MKRILPLVFAGILTSVIGAGCSEREAQSQGGSEALQQEQQPMNQGQTGSEYQTQEQQPAEQR